jgi:NAD(P)H dehydrogenase (quinone)
MSERIIAVVGATGRTGTPLVRALERRSARVRIARRVSQSDMASASVELRQGDALDVESPVAAFEGADAIHYIPPPYDPRDAAYAYNIIAAAQRAGISRIVYHSVLHPATPEMPHHLRKSQTELLLRHSPLTWTIIQPGMYAQSALAFFNASTGELMPAFETTQPFTPIHEGDLAEAAAIIHTTEGHAFASYELAGSELLDFNAMGHGLSEILGKPITTRKVSIDTLTSFIAAARNYSPEQLREFCLMCDHYNLYGLAGNGNVLRMILGRESTTFAEAMRHSLSI